jgi:N-acetylglutamate synthase-like GNAT family acetyltransferase
MPYELLPPATTEEWAAYNDIRRIELFEAKGRFGVYDANHPDEFLPGSHPLLLRLDGRPIGTVRLDERGEGGGVMRLVAILKAEQGKGHGRHLQQLVEAICRQRGIGMLYINSAPEAVGFYEKLGWERHSWEPGELVGIASTCIQMRKVL